MVAEPLLDLLRGVKDSLVDLDLVSVSVDAFHCVFGGGVVGRKDYNYTNQRLS